MVRHNNQLADNLPQLQNLIKRDAESYADDFQAQYNYLQNTLEVFVQTPSEENKLLEELVIFIAQTAQCYPEVATQFPKTIAELLRNYSTTLHPSVRNCFVRALVLLRNKGLIKPLELLQLFYQLLRCQDKHLRTFLQSHIVTDIKNINAKGKDLKLNSSLQNFMFSMLNDTNPKAAKMSMDIMVELFKKNIWNDAKTVNVIATVGCFSKITKVQVAALKFFLGHDDEPEESESDEDNTVDLKAALMQNRVNKKTKKRQKQLVQIKKQAAKAEKKKKNAPAFNFSGIHLIHDPQDMADKLFKQLKSSKDDMKFEVKLMHLDVISRLIGIHELFVLDYYDYVVRFVQPRQRQVTRILQFAAQASHENVPGESIEPILNAIANNFITERNSSDVMAIGLNATREICMRCPLAMGEDLLRDLAMYKTYKDKSVMMAARSLITLYRDRLPALLHKKDRGRQTEAQAEYKVRSYGEKQVHDTVPGAESLLFNAKTIDLKSDDDDDDDSDNDGGWIKVAHSDEEDFEATDGSDGEDDEEAGSEEEQGTSDDDGEDDAEDNDDGTDEDKEEVNEPAKADKKKSDADSDIKVSNSVETSKVKIIDEKEAAQTLAITRIFTDEDFKRINAANIKKTVVGARKRPLEVDRCEFVKLDKIEMIYKKRKHDKESRLETVKNGKTDRQQFGWKDGRKNEFCSKTNKEKRKNKNFSMMRSKAFTKVKKSFRDKQLALRKHLLLQKKMK